MKTEVEVKDPYTCPSLSGVDQGQRVFKGPTVSERVGGADIEQAVRMQSLFRSVSRPVNLCHRRSLFSAAFPVCSAREGSSSLLKPGKSPTVTSGPRLSDNSERARHSIAHMSSSVSHPEYRLPLNAKPTHYDLTIRTNLEDQTFDGFVDVQCVTNPILSTTKSHLHVSLSLDILQDTLELTFNSSDLTLSRPSIHSETLAFSVDVDSSITFNEKRGRATVKLAKTLPAGSKARFKIAYKGDLLSNMTGYYKSVWDHDGKKDYYSLTQFEVTPLASLPSISPLTTSA
jgi:hypothetical protein